MKASMRSFLVVEAQPRGQCGASLVGVGVGHGVGPLAEQCLDDAFGFTVGLRTVRSGALGSDAEPATGFTERARTVGTTIVGEDALDLDATAAELAHSTQPEA